MSEHDVARRAAVGFKEYVDELRSQRSKKPNTGLKGVNERGRKFEARNTPFPVRSFLAPSTWAGAHAPATTLWQGGIESMGSAARETRRARLQSFGTYDDADAAATAYDIGYILFRGTRGKINRPIDDYVDQASGRLHEDLHIPDQARRRRLGTDAHDCGLQCIFFFAFQR